jgi:hypothetical protein
MDALLGAVAIKQLANLVIVPIFLLFMQQHRWFKNTKLKAKPLDKVGVLFRSMHLCRVRWRAMYEQPVYDGWGASTKQHI